MAKIYDVTVPLSSDVPAYPGDPPFELVPTHRLADGQRYNATRFSMGAHVGTHVDAPSHFLEGGATLDQLAFEILIGKARVVEVTARERVDRSHLEALDLRDHIRVLLKTRMSGQMHRPPVQEDHVYLTVDAARHLVHAGIKLVGIDYLSVDRCGSADYPSHHALLEAGVVIVEGLDLSEVAEGEYDMTCLPLRIAGGEAAPARVILRTRL
jgi:arylformamidase